jgi:tetratricopeptide (TPR) repeat protein
MGNERPWGLIRRLGGVIPHGITAARQNDHRPASDWLARQMREALARIPADSPRRADLLSELGVALTERFQQTGRAGYLDEAVEVARSAVSAAAHSRPSLRAKCLSNLGMHLLTRWRLAGSWPDLDEALSASQAAVDAVPSDSRVRGMYLGNLSSVCKARFDVTGEQADLAAAIAAGRAALLATRPGPWLAHPLINLSNAVRAQAELADSRTDTDEAIELARAALNAAAPGNSRRSASLGALGNAYLARFRLAGEPDDAVAAVRYLRQSVAELPPGHPDLGRASSNLVAALTAQFGRSGDLADAAEAIGVAREALKASLSGPGRAVCLSSLGGALRARFEKVGEIADLDEAIAAVREATDIGATVAERVMYADNLSALLLDRFAGTRDPADLDEAIDAARRAVELAADLGASGHLYLSGCQAIMGVALWQRYRRTQDSADLEKSIESCRAAVHGASARHHSRAMFLHNLANVLLARLFSRPEQTWTAAELDEIIDTAGAAADAVPDGHPNRVGYLLNLGTGLEARFRTAGNPQDMAKAIACWRAAAGTESGPASKRLNVARMWGQSAAEYGLTSEAEAGFAAAVELLPLQAWRGLHQHTREEVLSGRAGLASDAAAWAVSNGHLERAVELLELGRNVLWSQLLQLRSDLGDLRNGHPDIARGLDALREILDRADDWPADLVPSVEDGQATELFSPRAGTRPRDEARIAAAHDWDRLMIEIRALPGYASFLRAPEYAELTSSIGNRTVVIINVSRYRCDALAVSSSAVRLIPLPELTLDAASKQEARFREALDLLGRSGSAKTPDAQVKVGPVDQEPGTGDHIRDVLAWLGDKITFPVLDALGYESGGAADPRRWPRVWWCPTGPLSALPLHAAGVHEPGQHVPAVHERVVSSYIPSLRTLHRAGGRARSEDIRGFASPGRPHMLLVTMPITPYLPGGAPLRYVEDEASVVAQRFPQAMTHYNGRSATREAVLHALATHDYVHFACHGDIDLAEPSAGGLCLEDGRLTIAALSGRDLSPDVAQLAFLSACRTSTPSPELPDETITMAAALQLAGFRHVIATMWAIADRLAPTIADEVYKALASGDGASADGDPPAAYALHAATTKLRDKGYHPASWTAYIHTGL